MDMVTKEYFNEKTKFPCLYNKSFTLITFDSNIEAKIFFVGVFSNSYIKNCNLKT